MKITTVRIRNFRSIKDIEIHFKNVFGLIGSNSAGKSNILRAINLVLGDKYPMAHNLSKKDFFDENVANNMYIEIRFDKNFTSYNRECNGLVFKTEYDTQNSAILSELKAIDCTTNMMQNYNIKGDIKEKCSIVYVPAMRNFEYHLQSNAEWSLLGKIIKEFNKSFPPDRVAELIEKFSEVKKTLETDIFRQFEETFVQSFQAHTIPSEHDVSISFRAANPKNYYKTIEVVPKEVQIDKNIDQLGEGMKNLIFLSLLRAYAKTFPGSTIFLIEEPELYLHPQGRMDLYDVFQELAREGSQFIYTTHSQEFLDIEHFGDIGVVRKIEKDGKPQTTICQIDEHKFVEKWREVTGSAATAASIGMFLKNASDAETNKGFFAKCIVLVEGNTEKWMLPIYARKLGLKLEKRNIELVATTGKNNIEKFYLIYTQLEYPVYVIFDGDKSKNEGEETNLRLTKILGTSEQAFPPTTISEKYSVFEEDIEAELKKNIQYYREFEEEAKCTYGIKSGAGKQAIARHIAIKSSPPPFIKEIIEKIQATIK